MANLWMSAEDSPETTLAHSPISVASGRHHSSRVMPGSRVRWWVALLAVWLVSAAYVGSRIDRGWIPLDEGTLGQSAERVLAGEMPHRDFDDVYTGGLSQADAIVYRWTSVRLVNLRWALYGVFVLWVPVVFYIASRFARPAGAAIATLLCVVWSIPTYPAAMPSWYNLLFATFGTAALIRFTETTNRRWIVCAGVLGGLSILVKIVGLYYIAAALLFFVWHEYQVAHGRAPAAGARPPRWYAILVAAALALFVVMLVKLVAGLSGHSRFLHFVLPGTLLAAFLGDMEWRRPPGISSATRFRFLAALVGSFLLGVALPIALFLVPYVATHAVGDLVRGVFVAPARRVPYAVELPVPLKTIWTAAVWVAVFVPSWRRVERYGVLAQTAWMVLAVAAGLLLVVTTHGGPVYADLWLAIRYLGPVTVVGGGLLLWRLEGAPLDSPCRREQIWLLVCMTALCSLVQVPYAGSYYILYFAPIAILALLAIVTSRAGGAGPRPVIAAGDRGRVLSGVRGHARESRAYLGGRPICASKRVAYGQAGSCEDRLTVQPNRVTALCTGHRAIARPQRAGWVHVRGTRLSRTLLSLAAS